jgi:hypothetical protein
MKPSNENVLLEVTPLLSYNLLLLIVAAVQPYMLKHNLVYGPEMLFGW